MNHNMAELQAQLDRLKKIPSTQDLYEQYYKLMTLARQTTQNDLHSNMAPFYFQYGNYLFDQCMLKSQIFGQQVPKHVKKLKKKGKRVVKSANKQIVHQSEFCTITQDNKQKKQGQQQQYAKKEVEEALEEVEDQQLAYQNLQTAKKILTEITQPTLANRIMLMSTKLRLGDLLANMDRFSDALAYYHQAIESINLSQQQLAKNRSVAQARFMISKVILYQNGQNRQDRALSYMYMSVNALILHLKQKKGIDYPVISDQFMQVNDRSTFLIQVQDDQSQKQLKQVINELLDQISDIMQQKKARLEVKKEKQKMQEENKNLQKGFTQIPKDLSKTSISLGTFGNATKQKQINNQNQNIQHIPKKLP